MIKRILQRNKEAKNAIWLICGKVLQMLLSFYVGILYTRYCGPSNLGLINYGSAYASFFMPLCTLGLNSIIVKDFVDNPNEEGEALGTAIFMRFITSMVSAMIIVCIVIVIDHNSLETILIVSLCSMSLLFQAFDTFNYWFQSRYKSKSTAIATLIAYTLTSVYKLVLLKINASVRWFAFATSVDYIILAISLLALYKKNSGPKLSMSIAKGKYLISNSYHYILSGMMVAIYTQTDKLMLKWLLSEREVGYYSAAATISAMWVFVLQAIVDSIFPSVFKYSKTNNDMYLKKNKQLYAIVFYLSLIVSTAITLFSEILIKILYGVEYIDAVNPLRIITWYTAFSFLGVARNAWIVTQNKQKHLKYMYFSAAIINICLNSLLIPTFGTSGAAVASLITQIFTSLLLPLFIPALKPNAILILDAIRFNGVR